MTYKTVTNGYDWGPAIDKVILDLGVNIDATTVTKEAFTVTVHRVIEEVHESQRDILAAYTSDEQGNVSEDSRYITLELEVGPTLTEGSPFIYNILNGRNEYVETSYKISIDTASLISKSNEIPFDINRFDQGVINTFAGDIQPLCDLFAHNQNFESEHVKLKYAYFEPNPQKSNHLERNLGQVKDAKIPLIIWLHGAGEGGFDTTIAVLGNKVTHLVTPEIQNLFGDAGAYVLVPQAPTMWMDYNGQNVYNSSIADSDGHSFYSSALMKLIQTFVLAHPDIDIKRIYIGGCSNGGYMTVKLLMDYPDYFAAAFPTCEAYSVKWLSDEKIDQIKSIPIWLVHAQNDPVLRISEFDLDEKVIPIDDFSNALYTRLVNAGNTNVHYSRYDRVVDSSDKYLDVNGHNYEYHGHWSWVYTLNNECEHVISGRKISLFEWLSEQTK